VANEVPSKNAPAAPQAAPGAATPAVTQAAPEAATPAAAQAAPDAATTGAAQAAPGAATAGAARRAAGAAARAVRNAIPAAPGADAASASAITEDTSPILAADDSLAALPATLRENSYFYQSFGTTDPFRSLLAGDFEPKQQVIVDLHTVKMVGVIWEPDEIAAMVQDAQGFGYTLRPGDTVKNGTVVSVTQETLVGRLNIFGQTTQLTLRLQHDED
jgi:hypothetical protein